MNDGCVTTSGDARSSPINIPKLHLISHMTPLSDREDSPIDFPLDISDLNSPKQRPPSPPPSPPLSPPLPLQELCAHLKEPESSCTSGQNSSQAQPRPKAAIERVNGVKDIKSFVRKSARLSLTFDNEPGCSKDDFLLLGDLLKWKEETRCGTPSENQALNASSPSQPGDYESYSSSPLSGSSPIISKIPFLCSDSSERTPSPSHNLRDETGLRSNRSGLHSPRPTVKSLPQDLMSPRKTLLHHDQQPFFELPFDEKKNSPRSISSGRALLLSSPSSSPFSMSFGSGLTALGHKKKRSTVDSNQFRAMTTIFSGFLNFKELHKRSSRKKRWVVLKQEGFLLIYKVPEAELQGSDLKESINLQYSVVKPSRTKTYKFQILSPATSYSFSCDTLSSEWIQTLQSLTEQLMHLMTGAHLSSGDTPSLNTGSEKSVSQGSHRMFKQIASLSSNSHCADCNCNGTRWISLRFGVFICDECSLIHRGFPNKLSNIKSIYTSEIFPNIKIAGNHSVNRIFEERLSSYDSLRIGPNSPFDKKKEFIHQKYLQGKFLSDAESHLSMINEESSEMISPAVMKTIFLEEIVQDDSFRKELLRILMES